jgi:hypothetical protein
MYIKIYNNCTYMFRFWLNHHQRACSLCFAKLHYWYQLIYWVFKIVRSCDRVLTLILLTWRIWWAPNNASKWQMGFNSTFKVLIQSCLCVCVCIGAQCRENSRIGYNWSINILHRADVLANIARTELERFHRYLLQLE